jgi:hypothetical protein
MGFLNSHQQEEEKEILSLAAGYVFDVSSARMKQI